MTICSERICESAAALGLGLNEAQGRQLACYAALLLRWNATYNLTSISNEDEVLTLHLLDSLSLVKAIEGRKIKRVLDVGSGGGLPAIPLAVMRPEISVTMVDAVKKKVLFLRQVILETQLKNARAIHSRVEMLKEGTFDAITSRAFAALPLMVELTKNALSEGGYWYAMKGKNPVEEIKQLPRWVTVEEILPLKVGEAKIERHLVCLRMDEDSKEKI